MTEKAAEALTYYEGEVYKDYSGRHMYGNTTYGIEFESMDDFYNAISEVMLSEDTEDIKEVAEFLTNVKVDSLGLDIIVY